MTEMHSLDDAAVQAAVLQHGLLKPQALSDLTQVQQGAAQPTALLTLLLRSGAVPERALFSALAQDSGLPLLDRNAVSARWSDSGALVRSLGLSWNWCRDQRFALLPGADAAQRWQVVLAGSPSTLVKQTLAQLQWQHQVAFDWALLTTSDYLACHEQSPHQGDTQLGAGLDLQHLKELAEEGPVIELVNSVLSRAVSMRASDIHLEPADKGFEVRLRVDGSLVELERYSSVPYEAVVCRVKILSTLDIAERRLPQDGRLDARVNGIAFDVRVSVIPTARGESVVLRLLRQERTPQSLHDLGLSEADAALLEGWLRLPNGLVLVTGPTGSGKSTTLYTAIDLLGRRTDKIITVEDPVEYKLPGVSQIQVNAEIGLDFAQALRSILRHDPDVILVGEIRDGATAQIATQAALTGHLVLSTLHTNTAAGAVTRLLDMGVDSFLLADSLKGVMAQRLVRRLCPHCAAPLTDASPQVLERVERARVGQPKLMREDGQPARLMREAGQPARLMRAVGCAQCNHTGYSGRIGIYDLVPFNAELAARIKPGITAADIEQAWHGERHVLAWADGWRKAAAGLTTVEEILSNTSEVALGR